MSDTPLSVSGTITPTGALPLIAGIVRGGTLSPSNSSYLNNIGLVPAGSLTPTGSERASVSIVRGGTITPAASLLASRGQNLAGTVSPAGALARSPSTSFAGSLTLSATLARGPSMHFPAGTLTPFGALSAGAGESPCNIILDVLMNRVASMLDDPLFVYYTQAEVKHALNWGQRLWALLTLCIERTATFNLSGGATFYNITDQFSDFLVPLKVYYSTTRLRNETIHNMDLRSATWRTTVGNPRRYSVNGLAPALLALTPHLAGAGTLSFTYAAEPAEMTAVTDFPEIPPEQQVHLPDFAYWLCRLKEGGAEAAAAGQYLQRYLAAAQKYGSFARARSRAQMYDTMPYDLKTFDTSRFEIKIKQLMARQQKQKEGQ